MTSTSHGPGRCRSSCFSPSAPKFCRIYSWDWVVTRPGGHWEGPGCLRSWVVTRTLKVRHQSLALVRSVGHEQGWGAVAGLVVPEQDSVLTPGVAKDKIFLNPAALPWFCRQELPSGRGILTLRRICCRRDFSLTGRRAATQWKALRDPLLPDGWPWTTDSPWGLSAPQHPAVTLQPCCLTLLALSVPVCHPCSVPALEPQHQALSLCPSKSCV